MFKIGDLVRYDNPHDSLWDDIYSEYHIHFRDIARNMKPMMVVDNINRHITKVRVHEDDWYARLNPCTYDHEAYCLSLWNTNLRLYSECGTRLGMMKNIAKFNKLSGTLKFIKSFET